MRLYSTRLHHRPAIHYAPAHIIPARSQACALYVEISSANSCRFLMVRPACTRPSILPHSSHSLDQIAYPGVRPLHHWALVVAAAPRDSLRPMSRWRTWKTRSVLGRSGRPISFSFDVGADVPSPRCGLPPIVNLAGCFRAYCAAAKSRTAAQDQDTARCLKIEVEKMASRWESL